MENTPNKVERFTETGPKRLTALSPEEVRALPPEQYKLWNRQAQEEWDDFVFLNELADDLYPLLRKYFKRMRDSECGGDLSRDADTPLFAAFDRLLSLVDRCLTDAAFLERFRHAQAVYNARPSRRDREGDKDRRAA